MQLDDDPNGYEDLTRAAGCDLIWGIQLEPWDATGTSAMFLVGVSSFSMTIAISADADDAVSTFSVHLTPSQLVTLGLGTTGSTASYVVHWTDSLGAVWQLGYGEIIIT